MCDNNRPTTMTRIVTGLLAVLLIVIFSPNSQAQFSSGGSAVLGNFSNPPNFTDTTGTICAYDQLHIDLAQGKVFAHLIATGNRPGSGAQVCLSSPQDVTA